MIVKARNNDFLSVLYSSRLVYLLLIEVYTY